MDNHNGPKKSYHLDILRGLSLLAMGKAEGIGYFGKTSKALVAAAVPWVGLQIMLVFVMRGKSSHFAGVAILVLLSIASYLLRLVILREVAEKWERRNEWIRCAVAMTWAYWIILLVFLIIIGVSSFIIHSKSPFLVSIAVVGLLFVALYVIWIDIFVIKCGLNVSISRAAVVFIALIFADLLLASIIREIPPHNLPAQMELTRAIPQLHAR